MDVVKHINGVPTKMICFEREVGDSLEGVNYLILVIPGNPGIIEFYRDFMDQLSLEMREKFPKDTVPVWGISHAGHEVEGVLPPFPTLDLHPELYSLEGQIVHKEAFVKEFIQKQVKVLVIGHSIGCHVVLQLLKRNAQFSSQVIKVMKLFPTIQRMRDSPNGKFFVSVQNLQWIPLLSLMPLDYLPSWIRGALVSSYIYWFRPYATDCIRAGIKGLLNKLAFEKVIAMANCEMEEVCDLDVPTLEKNLDRIFFYFASTDGWCPIEFVENMKKSIPNLNNTVCTEGIEHAFVIKDSRSMASILIPHMTPLIQ